jgi:hypothetical protein
MLIISYNFRNFLELLRYFCTQAFAKLPKKVEFYVIRYVSLFFFQSGAATAGDKATVAGEADREGTTPAKYYQSLLGHQPC